MCMFLECLYTPPAGADPAAASSVVDVEEGDGPEHTTSHDALAGLREGEQKRERCDRVRRAH